MEVSKRISAVAASATLAITGRAKQMLGEGIDVVSFGAGEPDFDTPQFIKDAAISALLAGDTKYTPRAAAGLREAIARKLNSDNGMDLGPDQVVVTFGAKHALFAACQCLLNPGDKVLIPSPYWVSYPEMVRIAGGEPVFLKTDAASRFKITPQQILDAVGQAGGRAKALILNSPSNPTGTCYSPKELRAIAEAVGQTDLVVLSDEIYEKLIYGRARFISFAAIDPRLSDRTLTFNGLSKTFAMTGWRVGWVAGPGEMISAIRRLMSHETTSPVSFAQAGALAAYTSPEAAAAVESMRKEFEKRGEHMAGRLNAIEGLRCLAPAGAFYCFPDVSAHFGRKLGSTDVTGSLTFAAAALAHAQVAVVPGEPFGEDRCIRLSFATSMEQIDKGLDRLEELLNK